MAAWPRSNGKTWVPFNVLSAVQEFVKNPSNNFGFLIVNTKSTQEIDFASSENANSQQRPKLTITYDLKSGVGNKISSPVNDNLIIRSKQRKISIYSSAGSSVFSVTVATLDGKSVLNTGMAPYEEKLLTELNPGVYIIKYKNNKIAESRFITVLT